MLVEAGMMVLKKVGNVVATVRICVVYVTQKPVKLKELEDNYPLEF